MLSLRFRFTTLLTARYGDSICLKIGAAAMIVIGFVCAVGRMVLTTEIIGYCLMGTLAALAIIRTVIFCVMDKEGV